VALYGDGKFKLFYVCLAAKNGIANNRRGNVNNLCQNSKKILMMLICFSPSRLFMALVLAMAY